jgi:hypothetical protein
MHLLEKIGKAVRDTIYEAFHELTETVDLEELKDKGYEVKEFPLSSSGLDKLYVLSHNRIIRMGGTIVIDPTTKEPVTHLLNPNQTLKTLKHISKSAKVASPKADNPNTKGDK